MRIISVTCYTVHVRIISGKYGGRIIKPPKNFKARPTTDLAREGLFNILNNRIDFEGLRVLDLFAGTGSVGFEFASRGASRVDMVEINFIHFNFIKKAIQILGAENVKVMKSDFFRIIPGIKQNYDLVFADPPYDMKNFDLVPKLVLSQGILEPGGFFILEHSRDYDFSELPGFIELRKYGSVHFSFFGREKE